MHDSDDVTQILQEASEGSTAAVSKLFPIVYDELRRLAQSHLHRERDDHTLQATALVHEAYLRLVDQTRVQWKNRNHFFATAAQAIRRILVDHARAKATVKRGGTPAPASLDEVAHLCSNVTDSNLVALDIALTRLAKEDSVKARVVELRFFGGLTSREVAEVIGVHDRTAERYWEYARAWLYRELEGA